ncbi:RNA polymerase sigma factor, partial [Effusibacillus pohliae]|uniref:RNA polymerase sigma factor n=1 Tax=Effusibacillus pohliae TaxID=232270 RepID=UPI00035CE5E9
LKGEREWVGSMLHESAEVIPMIAAYCSVEQLGPKERRLVQRLQRLTYGKKEKIHSWDTAWMERLPDQRSLEDEIIEKIEGTEMEDAMTIDLYHLPERQREALELLASGMSYSEVAEMMQIAKGSVSKHLQLARKKLEDGAQLAWQLE